MRVQVPPQLQLKTKTMYEHKVETIKCISSKDERCLLSERSEEGYELVTVLQEVTYYKTFYWKRLKQKL